jgi:LPXTG-site transpeptidase (sortase) family protein
MPDQTNQPYQPIGGGQLPDPSSIYPEPQASLLSHDNATIKPPEKDPAVEMIRAKIRDLYSVEPDAKQEIAEAQHHTHPGSKHQQYMASLQASGKSLAEIQAAWHNYYIGLPDSEKYEIWREFYVQNGDNIPYQQVAQPSQPAIPAQPVQTPQPAMPWWSLSGPAQPAQPAASQPLAWGSSAAQSEPHHTPHHAAKAAHHRISGRGRALSRSKAAREPRGEKSKAIKQRIVETVKTATSNDGVSKLNRKHHIQSIVFGLSCGFIVILIFLFSFFNELIIAPFIQPSRNNNDTPVIVDTASAVITGGPKVIIPKINLEIPVDYSQTSIDESAIELALDNGVVHYPSTSKPGETGNAAFFGHSSNNIFNPGKYKFAFVLLHELQAGDVFYLNYGDKTYAYKVFDKKIVTPSQVDVLNPIPGKSATATLITCDPPGTSINRLVVVGEQISPDPNTNGQPQTQTASAGSSTTTAATETSLPGNGPGLWSRIVNSIF